MLSYADAAAELMEHVGDVGRTVPMVYAVSLYILVMEVSSIVENLANAYPELKQTKLLSFFANSQDDVKEV